jgi:hypothetical protein
LSGARRNTESKKYVYIWARYSLEDKQGLEKRKLFKANLEEYIRIEKILQIIYRYGFGMNLDSV